MNPAIESLYIDILEIYASVVEASLGLEKLSTFWTTVRPHDAPNDSGIFFGRGDPNHSDSRYQYKRSYIELIADSRAEGRHVIQLRRMALVFAFSVWETRHRPNLIHQAGTDNVQSNAFGDLRHLRRCLLHAGGVLDRRLDTIYMFRSGDEIIPSEYDFRQYIPYTNRRDQ